MSVYFPLLAFQSTMSVRLSHIGSTNSTRIPPPPPPPPAVAAAKTTSPSPSPRIDKDLLSASAAASAAAVGGDDDDDITRSPSLDLSSQRAEVAAEAKRGLNVGGSGQVSSGKKGTKGGGGGGKSSASVREEMVLFVKIFFIMGLSFFTEVLHIGLHRDHRGMKWCNYGLEVRTT